MDDFQVINRYLHPSAYLVRDIGGKKRTWSDEVAETLIHLRNTLRLRHMISNG